MIRISIFLILLVLTFKSFSQDFEKDLKVIISKMDTVSAISISAKATLYSKKGGNIIYSSVSSMDKKGQLLISRLGEMEMYRNKEYEVQIDHEEKRLLIHKLDIKSQKIDVSAVKELNKLMSKSTAENKQKKYSLVSEKDGIKTYSIKNIDEYKECTITIDLNKFKINKIIYEFNDQGENKNNYCVIDYLKFDYSPSFSKSFFNENNYFTFQNKTYKLSERLKTYKLVLE